MRRVAAQAGCSTTVIYTLFRRCLEPLVRTTQACLNRGVFRPGHAETMATELWIVTHGLVSVELAGYFPGKTASADTMHEGALDDLIRAWSQGWHFKTLKY